MFVEPLAIGFGTECGAHEEDFAELEICVIHEREILFARDDPTQEFFGLLEEIEAFVFVTSILGELVAALCGKRDGKEIPTAFDGRARGKLLHVLTQTGSGFVEVGDLVFAERTTVDDRLEVGRLGILCSKVVVALDGLLEDALAAGIRGGKRHGFGGENLSAQVVDHLKLIRSERWTCLGFFQAGECLVELTKVELADTELDRRRLDENIGGITSDDGLVGGCGTFVIGAGKQAVGGFVFLGGGLRLSVECTRPEEKRHQRREDNNGELFHDGISIAEAGG